MSDEREDAYQDPDGAWWCAIHHEPLPCTDAGHCESRFKVSEGVTLRCTQHLGALRRWKHSARYLGIRWYWTTAEAEPTVQDHTDGSAS